MAQQLPSTLIPFGGINTRGSALDRPPDSAIRFLNFRLMPASTPGRRPYLRLRGGKTVQYTSDSGDSFRKFYEFQRLTTAQPRYPITQFYDDTAGAHYGSTLNIDSTPYTIGNLLQISSAYGTNPLLVGGCAVTTVRDKRMLANGLGVRDSSNSRPPFATYDGSVVRYCGLDALCVGGNPTVSAGGSGNNNMADLGDSSGVSIYVGLHNVTTQHFSNAVFAGRLTSPATDTEITVSNLSRLKAAYNNATEQAELRYVFYATFDGGAVAYLILNSSLDGPLTAALSDTSKSLSVTTVSTQGFVLDNTQERPTRNHPPRPMSHIAYANGRVYGVLNGGGGGTSGFLPDQPAPGTTSNTYYRDFSYQLTNTPKDVGSIVWSAAASQTNGNDWVGVPEESFPFNNRKACPNGEYPVVIDATPGGQQLLVITANGTFILSEAADGLHEWITLSDIHGAANLATYVRTPRGPVWLTQRSQLAMFNSITQSLEILSEEFDELLRNSQLEPVGAAACYILDPKNKLDCYKIYRFNSTLNVVYYFNFCPSPSSGKGGAVYEEQADEVAAAGSLRDVFGRSHFIYCSDNRLLTQETNPYNGLVPVADTLVAETVTEVDGDIYTQWLYLADRLERGRLTDIDVIGDGALSEYLDDTTPIRITWYEDLTSTPYTAEIAKALQSTTNLHFKARMRTSNPFYLKLRIRLLGHSEDLDSPYYLDSDVFNAELDASSISKIYGCIFSLFADMKPTGNRP